MSDWKTMDTAPKDGSRIILYTPPYGAGSGNWRGSMGGWDSHFCLNLSAEPTHWQPLPKPPAK